MGRRRGSTLAEVLVSMLLVAPVLLVVVGLFPYSRAINQRAWALSTASELARSQLENLRAGQTPQTYLVTREHTDFRVSSEVAPYRGLSLQQLTVVVSWGDRNYRLSSLAALP